MSDEFLIGDSDLMLLGVAAALAARRHAKRKDFRLLLDSDAQQQLLAGFKLGADMPLDDVPEVWMSVACDESVLQMMQGACE